MAEYEYDREAKRYRDASTLKVIPNQEMVGIRNAIIDAGSAELRVLAAQRVNGEITSSQFETQFQIILLNIHGAQYMFGRGGIDAMEGIDFTRLGSNIRTQNEYLAGFVRDLDKETMSEGQAVVRAGMYADSGTKSFEQGKASSFGIFPDLPLYPGDNCEGMTRCRCSWDIEEDDDSIKAYWSLGGDNPCGPCQANFAAYYPFTIEKDKTKAKASDPVLLVRRGTMDGREVFKLDPAWQKV